VSFQERIGDGDETAGVRLCHWLKEEGSEWKNVPFLIYCFNLELVQDLPTYKGVFMTKDGNECRMVSGSVRECRMMGREIRKRFGSTYNYFTVFIDLMELVYGNLWN